MSVLQLSGNYVSDLQSSPSAVNISIDGNSVAVNEGELLVEAVLRHNEIPHICYHSPLMGPIQTCDTCLVEVDGQLVRSCGHKVSAGMQIVTESKRAVDARAEAFDVNNHPNWSGPNLNPTSSQFGEVTSKTGLVRTLQLSLRYAF